MKIKNPDHAVRVLEFLIKELERASSLARPKPQTTWNDKMLLDGVKAVLIEAKRTPDCIPPETDFWLGERRIAVDLAQAYAPRMAEAGMVVPE